MTAMHAIYPPHDPPAGRRVPRPTTIAWCQTCGDFLGRGYRDCPTCHEVIEAIWRADWLALLEVEGLAPGGEDERLLAGVIIAEWTRHPWTIVDYALTLLRCEECGAELGGGPTACANCAHAFGNLWAPELEAGARMDEHAIRVGRLVARHPHRYSDAIATGWCFSLPLLLTGALPTTAEAQRLAAWLKGGGNPARLAAYPTPAAAIAALDRRAT
jgi:hypothetical protein